MYRKAPIDNPGYHELMEASQQSMWIISDSDFRILEVNTSACNRYQVKREDFLKLHIFQLHPETEVGAFTTYLESELKNPGLGQPKTWKHRLKSNTFIDVEIVVHSILWNGNRVGVITCWEVTNRLQMEKLLRQTELKYRTIFENTREGIYQSTPEGRFITVNPSLAKIMGYNSPEDIVTSLHDIGAEFYVDPNERARILKVLTEDGQAVDIESQVFTKDKRIIWIRDHIRAIKNSEGAILYLEGSLENITERKETFEKLLMHQQFSNMIMNAQSLFIGAQDSRYAFDVLLQDILLLTKSDYGFIGEVLYKPNGEPFLKTHTITNIAWNDETRAFYNNNIQEGLVFDNLKTLFGEVMITGKPVISNKPAADPRSGGLPKGHPPLNAFLGLPFGLDGKIEGMLGLSNRPGGYDEELINFLQPFVKNISHLVQVAHSERLRKHAETELQTQFNELRKTNHELDHFVYSASHDLRAPLASILGLVNVAEVDPTKESIPKYLHMIRESANKLDEFIGSILDHSRNSRMSVKNEEINFDILMSEVQQRFSLMQNAERISLKLEVDGNVPFFSDLTRLEIILNNLFSNAIKYQDLQKEHSHVIIGCHITADRLMLVVEDNGIGIEEKYIDEIFTMFFRASDKAKGSGLGLYIAREAVLKLGGSIKVNSIYGEFTRFEIIIPNRGA